MGFVFLTEISKHQFMYSDKSQLLNVKQNALYSSGESSVTIILGRKSFKSCL